MTVFCTRLSASLLGLCLFVFAGSSASDAQTGLRHHNVPPHKQVVVFLDPGHGGLNIGSIGHHGTHEKELTLDISERLRVLLESDGAHRVVMSRHDDSFVGLRERTRQANSIDANLFLSIHVNATVSPNAHGMETYFLAAQSFGDEVHALVIREEGYVDTEDLQKDSLSRVVYGLRLTGAQRESAGLAQKVLDNMVATTRSRNRGVRQAPFAVLKEATMPAIVVEVGYLSNPAEAALLKKANYRQRIARGIYRGILSWERGGGAVSQLSPSR
jgi:N-acetylmuramoyl-L-alanine amidase